MKAKLSDKKAALIIRQALLMIVDVLERRFSLVNVTTAEMRSHYKKYGPRDVEVIDITEEQPETF